MPILVISCSLNPESRSRVLAREAHKRLNALGERAELADIASLNFPVCDGAAAYAAPGVADLGGRIKAASAVLLAFPVYNYDASAACKNLIELTGSAWSGKVVGLLAAAGGANSFMAPLQVANSLMLDFRCIVLPRYVYAAGEAVAANAINDPDVSRRIDELAAELVRVSRALASPA
jgi:NAD(P)H-dependent FMN reductase